jgi:hypothetical protein
MKIAAVVIGLFVAALAYLSYRGWVDVKWVTMEDASRSTLTNASPLFNCSNIPTVDSIVTRAKSYDGVQGVELFIITMVAHHQEWLVREINKKLRWYTKTTTITNGRYCIVRNS